MRMNLSIRQVIGRQDLASENRAKASQTLRRRAFDERVLIFLYEI